MIPCCIFDSFPKFEEKNEKLYKDELTPESSSDAGSGSSDEETSEDEGTTRDISSSDGDSSESGSSSSDSSGSDDSDSSEDDSSTLESNSSDESSSGDSDDSSSSSSSDEQPAKDPVFKIGKKVAVFPAEESYRIDNDRTLPIILQAIITMPNMIEPIGNGKIVNLIAKCKCLMASSQWQQRYAGITAIGAIAEGCHSQMQKVLPDVLRQVLIFTGDSHRRVRFAACNCLGQLAVDFGEKFTKLSHKEVVPVLCNLLDDQGCPKVIGQAASALVNVVKSLPTVGVRSYLPHSILKTYTETMIGKIEQNMYRQAQLGRKFTLQKLLTLLAAIAGAMDFYFGKYFERFMPMLNEIIQKTLNNEEMSKLRGKAIECYSIIGLAVGKNKFVGYAKDFIGQGFDNSLGLFFSCWVF